MEESIKSVRFVHRLIIFTATALIVFSMSLEEPSSEHVDALKEFKILQPSLEKVSELHIEQFNDYYRKNGLEQIVVEEFPNSDVSGLRFIGAQDDQFGQPRFGAGTKAPLQSLYRYLLLTEDWENLTVWKVDLASFRNGIKAFKQNHPEISKITDIYISAGRPLRVSPFFNL